MDDKYILDKLQNILEEREWTYYRLAKEADISISTIRNIFRSHYHPSFVTLSKICDGLGITLSQFFSEESNYLELTEEQKQLLNSYALLSPHQRELVQAFIKGILTQ